MIIDKILLLASAFGTIFLLILRNTELLESCGQDGKRLICLNNFELIHNLLIFSPIIFFFSLVTYKMQRSTFTAWWKFARFAIPIIFILSFIINMELHHSPAGEFQNMFDAPALWLLYILFSIGSLIAIFIGWRKGSDIK